MSMSPAPRMGYCFMSFLKPLKSGKTQLRKVDLPLPSSGFRSVNFLKFPNNAMEHSLLEHVMSQDGASLVKGTTENCGSPPSYWAQARSLWRYQTSVHRAVLCVWCWEALGWKRASNFCKSWRNGGLEACEGEDIAKEKWTELLEHRMAVKQRK